MTFNPLYWAFAFILLAVWITALIAFRPGYWGGAANFWRGMGTVVWAAWRGRGAPKSARLRYQYTCLVCAACAAVAGAITMVALYLGLPHATSAVQGVAAWFVVILAAWALGAFVTGREPDAV